MADKDRIKWNRKYRETPDLLQERPPAAFVQKYAKAENEHEKAIDLACGNGRNTLYLAKNGFSVDAVDISSVALSSLSERLKELPVKVIEADLDTFTPEYGKYDLFVMTNYLDRALIRRCAEQMKKGSKFIIETYMQHELNEKRNSNPDFLLRDRELFSLFDDRFEVIAYETFWNEPYELYKMRKQGIFVRKRDSSFKPI